MGCLNKEKVIKALELEIKYPYTWDCKSECPYYNDTECDCYTQLAIDAIELLKKQEPKSVKNINDPEVGIRSGFCPECQELIYYNILHPANFCKYCGQAVKWNDY